jgi:hypothetical protein
MLFAEHIQILFVSHRDMIFIITRYSTLCCICILGFISDLGFVRMWKEDPGIADHAVHPTSCQTLLVHNYRCDSASRLQLWKHPRMLICCNFRRCALLACPALWVDTLNPNWIFQSVDHVSRSQQSTAVSNLMRNYLNGPMAS